MKFEDYIKSMNEFNKYKGSYLSDFFNDLKDDHKVEINDENSVFYAKDFYAEELTDKLYYFGKEKIKVVKINKDEEGILECVTIINKKTSSIMDVELTLGRDKEVEIQIKFKDGTDIVFHNKKDSNGKNATNAGKQIKTIYSLLTE